MDMNGLGKTDVYSNIIKNAKRIFGENVEIARNTYRLISSVVEYYEDAYYVYQIMGGGLGNVQFAESEIQKAEQEGDFIYIYDKYLWIDEHPYWVDGAKVSLYTTADETVRIANVSYELDNHKALFEEYKEQLNTYKHTFKKAEDGSYYWVSSEIFE